VGFGQYFIGLERLQRFGLGARESFLRRKHGHVSQGYECGCQSRMGLRIVWFFCHSILKISNALPQPIDGSFLGEGEAAKISFVGIRVNHARSLQNGLLLRGELNQNLAGNGIGDLALKAQHIADVSLIAIAPKMLVSASLDELCGDADLPAGTEHAAFDDSVHV